MTQQPIIPPAQFNRCLKATKASWRRAGIPFPEKGDVVIPPAVTKVFCTYMNALYLGYCVAIKRTKKGHDFFVLPKRAEDVQ